jgi:hypothetical protein
MKRGITISKTGLSIDHSMIKTFDQSLCNNVRLCSIIALPLLSVRNNLKGNKMIAILTKYIGPTNSRGSRIKAYTADWGDRKGFSVTIPYPYEHSQEMSHFLAVKALVKKHNLDWNLDEMRYGSTEKGYVFCFNHSIVKESEATE